MNDRLIHLTRVLSFALLCSWAGAREMSAQESQPELQANDTANEPMSGSFASLQWLQILVEGGREAAEALKHSELELVFNESGSGKPVLVTGQIDFPFALANGDGDSTMLVDRYPMVLNVDIDRDQASRFDHKISVSRLRTAKSEGVVVLGENTEPLSWRTFDVWSASEATPVWVVLIRRSQYCPLVDLTDVPDCDGFDAIPGETEESRTNMASTEGATDMPIRPRARWQADASDAGADVVADSKGEAATVPALPPPPEPVDYLVRVQLAFAGALESTYGRAARSLQDECLIEFVSSGDDVVVVADVDFRATPPVINATLNALPEAAIDLSGVNLRFERRANSSIGCVYNGSVIALDGMSQDGTMIFGDVVVPAQKPQFDLIYDLSGKVIGDDPSRSGEVVVGFATLVADALKARLVNVSFKYGAINDYFAWTPSNSVDPKLEPMSALDTDGSATPTGTQYLHALNEGVRSEMLKRIAESVLGVRPSQNATLLDQASDSFSTLLDAGDLRARDPHLRLLVQVADTARAACLDASNLGASEDASFRQTTVKRIVAVAELRLSFDAELTEETGDSLIWRCKPIAGSLVDTWLVPLSDVARDKDWQALTDQIGNMSRRLAP